MSNLREINFLKLIKEIEMPIIIQNNNGFIIYCNESAEQILGIKKEDYDVIKLSEIVPELFKSGNIKNEVEINRQSNRKFRVIVKDYVDGCYIMLEEITRIKELERDNHLLTTIFDAIHEGVQISDFEGITVLYNWACEKYEDLNREDVIGKKLIDVYKVSEGTCVHRKVLNSGKPIIDQHYQYFTQSGKKVDVIASVYPYFENNKVTGVYSINRDVTKLRDFTMKNINLRKKLAAATKNNKGNAYFIFEDIIGECKLLKESIKLAKKVSGNTSSVLIYGETGTGKELFAQSIHNASIYSDGPFIAINCAAIPENLLESILFGTAKGAFTGSYEKEGLFEQAEGGTLFFDEINSMPLNLQSKLLRVMQDKVVKRVGGKVSRSINCRFISATNVEPLKAINENMIRRDIFYRLAKVIIQVPPLKDRENDVILLSKHFMNKINKQCGTSVEEISTGLKQVFLKYNWPGNVRELENIIEGALNIMDPWEKVIELEHIPIYVRKKIAGNSLNLQLLQNYEKESLQSKMEKYEKEIIFETLIRNKCNISKSAEELGIYRQALQYRIKRFNLDIKKLKKML